MKSLVKKYLPYALVIFAIYLLVPLFFMGKEKGSFTPVLYYFIFLLVPVGCAALFSAKNGLDFLFSLIAPIAFLFTMFIYLGGFSLFSVILLVLYLVAGIFGLFLGDLVFGEERHKKGKRGSEKGGGHFAPRKTPRRTREPPGGKDALYSRFRAKQTQRQNRNARRRKKPI